MTWLGFLTLLKGLGGGVLKSLSDWRVIAMLCLAGLIVALAMSMRHDATVSAALNAEQTAYAQEHAAYLSEKAHSAAVEAARGQEHASAVSEASDTQKACSARVEAARKSATVIRQILSEPIHANPDPAEPELIPDSVWDIAQGR